MRILILILIHFFFLGCQAKKEIHPPLLEGYWEIEKVTSHGETFHPKGAAPLVDYYFLTKPLAIEKNWPPVLLPIKLRNSNTNSKSKGKTKIITCISTWR